MNGASLLMSRRVQRFGPGLIVILLGMLFGAMSVASPVIATVLMAAGVIGLLLLRTPDVGAYFVGGYWATFAVKSTVFSNTSIGGLFFPFYGALLLSILIALFRSGLRVNPAFFWALYTFLALVALSFIGFDQPIDSQVTQRLMAMLVSVLVLLNVRSASGLEKVPWFTGLAGLVIAVWVLYNAILGGFRYRGDVEVNENVAAFILGGCFLVMMAMFFASSRRQTALSRVLLLLSAGVMAYALLLLASRGMSIAAMFAVVLMSLHLVRWRRRATRLLLLLLAVMSLALLLPGGSGLLDRFSGESVDSAGDRLPIWTATLAATADSDLHQLLMGHGFNSSQILVRDATAVHTSTHNAYLAVMFEFGLLGLIAFLGMHLLVLVRGFGSRNILGTLAVGLIGYLLAANITSTVADDFMYWIVLGYAMACATFTNLRVDQPWASNPGVGDPNGG